MAPRILASFLILSSIFFCSACQTRLSSDSIISRESEDTTLWKRSRQFQEILLSSKYINTDKELNFYLNSLLSKVSWERAIIKNGGLPLNAYVLNDPSFNAFMLSNGSLFIHSGLLASLDDEAQLAAVMGRELSHFDNEAPLKEFHRVKASGELPFLPEPDKGAIGDLPAFFASLGTPASFYGYSNEDEVKADKDAFQSLLNNNYDVRQAPAGFSILADYVKEDKIKEPYFYSNYKRLNGLIKHFDLLCLRAGEGKSKGTGELNRSLYDNRISSLLLPTALMNINLGRYVSAQRLIERYLKNFPYEPYGYYCMGKLLSTRKEHGDLLKAAGFHKRALDQDTNYLPSYRELGMIYYNLKEYAEAQKNLKRYLSAPEEPTDSASVKELLEKIKKRTGKLPCKREKK